MELSDETLDELTRFATFSADTVAMERHSNHDTPAQVTRHIVRRSIEALAANDLIRVPDLPAGQIMFVPDPPFDVIFGPERRPVINNFGEHEQELCECDRPDERDNPHRHEKTIACIYWMAGRPSQADRIDACRQLNIHADPVDMAVAKVNELQRGEKED